MTRPYTWLALLICIVLLSHLPNDKYPLSADDFLWNSHIQGSEQLYNLGLTRENPDKSFWQKMQDGFLFYSDRNSSLQDQRNYGNMVWWGVSEGQLVPFRPLSSALLWLDLQLFDASQISTQWLSRLYFLIFTITAFVFYLKLEKDDTKHSLQNSNLALIFLSSLFLIFDLSVTQNLFWLSARNSYVSLTFGLMTLIFHMKARDGHRIGYLFFSAGFFILALLSAEAAISIVGYLIAYAWIKDKRGAITGLIWIIPYFLIIFLWRFIYNSLGFGAIHNGLYIDPGYNFFSFALRLLSMIPQIFTSLVTGVDGSIQSAHLDYRFVIILFSFVFTIAIIYALRKSIFKNSTTHFLFMGSILSIIPHTALITASSRSSVYAAVGFFYILAVSVFSLVNIHDDKLKIFSARFLAFIILIYHLFLPALFCTLLFAGSVHFADKGTGAYGDSGKILAKNPNTELVIINHPIPDFLLYSPFEWDQSGWILPTKIQALAPGLSSFTLEKISNSEFILSAESNFVLNQNSPMKMPDDFISIFFHYSHINRFNQSIITNPAQQFKTGQIIPSADMIIEIIEIQESLVTKIKIIFKNNKRTEDKIWQLFDWQSNQYRMIESPKIGEKIFVKGPF